MKEIFTEMAPERRACLSMRRLCGAAALALAGCVAPEPSAPRARPLSWASCAPEGAVVEAPAACPTPFCGGALPSWGTSLAVGDIDGDGLPDLLMGEAGPTFSASRALVLLRNLGGMRFAPVTRCAGLAGLGARAAIFVDIDNDDDQDLVIGGGPAGAAAAREDVIVFAQTAEGFRRRQTLVLGAPGVPTAFDATDLDRDGLPDILVGRGGTDRRQDYPVSLYFGRPDGLFVDRTRHVDNGGLAWIAAATDLDDDGRSDLLFLHDPAATYESPGAGAGTGPGVEGGTCPDFDGAPNALNWRSTAWRVTGGPLREDFRAVSPGGAFEEAAFTPMGLAVADFDDDGARDFMFSLVGRVVIFRGRRGSAPEEVPVPEPLRALAAEGDHLSAWSALARDLDHDGREDVLLTWGVIPPSARRRGNTLLRSAGPLRFDVAEGTGLERPEAPWSALALADFDRDGDEDVVLGAQSLFLRPCDAPRPALLMENRGFARGGHWLRLRLRGTVSTRDAFGARVEVAAGDRVHRRVVSGVGGTMSSGTREVHVGLGEMSAPSEVTIRWPSGAVQRLGQVAPDRVVHVEEPRWIALQRNGDRVEVTVRTQGLAELGGLRGFELTPEGEAQVVDRLSPAGSGVWRGALRARGAGAVVAEGTGSSLHAAQRFPAAS